MELNIDQTLQQAIVAHKEGKLEEAEKLYRSILKIEPTIINANHNLSILLHELGKLHEAEKHCKKVIELKPDFAEAYHNLGIILKSFGRFNDAEANIKKAIELDPRLVKALTNLGTVLQKLGKLDEAEANFKKATEIKPDYAEAFAKLGIFMFTNGRLAEAEASYKKAIELKPDYAEAYNNLDIIFKESNRFKESELYWKQAIKFTPSFAEAYFNLANIQGLLNNHNESLINYKYAYSLKPDLDYLLGSMMHAKMHLCMWDDLSHDLKKLTEKIKNTEKVVFPFSLLSLIDEPDIHKKVAEINTNNRFPKSDIFPKIKSYHNHKKIRIGYFSPDFKNHPVSYLAAELYEIHDRNKFEIHAFSFGPNTKDEFNIRIKAGVDHFHDIQMMSNHDVVKLARSLEIDIAIDLAGFTSQSRTKIFAMSAAPIQVNYLGYPGTMAADYIDYLIADHTLIPNEKKSCYSEKIIFMPNSYQPNISKNDIFEISSSREEVGLPTDKFVFCCFNNQYKITPITFTSWMKILNATDNSVLWLYVPCINAVENLKKEANKFGINEKRLIFAQRISHKEHLKRTKLADLFIDTLPFNAHTTASDALKMGLPVLTCIGNSLASRVAASLLKAVNLPEMITSTQKEYETFAVQLATDPSLLKIIKDKLVNNLTTAPLYDSTLYTRNLETAYQTIYKRHQNGLDPDDIEINC